MAVERDVKPRNMNFAKVEKRVGGGINREGAFIRINTVICFQPWHLDGQASGKILCCISEAIGCRKLKLGRDIGWGCTAWCVLDLTFDLAIVT